MCVCNPTKGLANNFLGRKPVFDADADRGAAQTVQQLLQSSSNIYVNPAYESLCTHKAQEAMQAAGLLQNHRQGKHQASLRPTCHTHFDIAALVLYVTCIMLTL